MIMLSRNVAAFIALLALVGLPFGLGNYGYYILASVMIYAMVALSLNVLIGMGGQISIGHAGFWALGAYASALSVVKLGLPFLAGIAVGGIVAALFGALVALPAAHFVALAEKAGMTRDAINTILKSVAERSAIQEFWITDSAGHAYLTNTGVDFTFSPDAAKEPKHRHFGRYSTVARTS
jgi:branched-subunit amino acid ABC-type transport system permease component